MTRHDLSPVPGAPALSIFLNQLRRLVGGWRWCWSAGLLVAVMLLAAVTAGVRYQRAAHARDLLAEDQARLLTGLTLDELVDVPIQVVKPAWRLTLVADGAQAVTPDVYSRALSPWAPAELHHADAGNYRLAEREAFDWTSILRVILPLVAFLLGYDLVCGERRAGNLKLLLSYPVSRGKMLAAQAAALWLCLAAPLVAGGGASLIVAGALGGGPPLKATELAKAALVLLVALWSAAFFSLIALLVSTLARDAGTSLSLLAWLWVTGVIAIPASSGLLAHRLFPVPSEQATARQLAAVDARVAHEFAGRERHWRRRALASADGFAWEKASAAAELRRRDLQEAVRHRVLDDKLAQVGQARHIAAVSPASLAASISDLLAGTGVERDASFLAQAPAYLTACAGRIAALDQADAASPHLYFFSGYLSQRPLPSAALPAFVFRERSLREGLLAARSRLALFALETVVLAACCLAAFRRLDLE